MKKLLTFLMMFILAISVGWAETAFYTLTPTRDASNSDYTGSYNVTIDGIQWTVNANMTSSGYWLIGGKQISNAARNLQAKTPMGSAISKVSVELGTIGCTLYNITLYVASDATFGNQIETVTKTDIAANSTVEFTPTSGDEWPTNAYYKIVFAVTNTGSSNKSLQFKKATFYKNDGGSTQPTTYALNDESSNGSVAFTVGSNAVTVAEAGATVTATATAADGYEFSSWSVPSNVTNWDDNGNVATFTMPSAAVTVSANFTKTQTTPIGDYVFYESFDKCKSTGGNDGSWSGNIASSEIQTTQLDNSGWTTSKTNTSSSTAAKAYAADHCVRIGNNTIYTTPSIDVTSGATYTLTFKAGAWNGGSESQNLKLYCDGGTLSSNTVTMVKGSWTSYTITVTASSSSLTLGFGGNGASNSRFFLDEVKLVAVASSAHSITLTQPETGGTISSDRLNAESGETVTLSASNTDGYELSSWTVTGATSGNAITVDPNNQFTMPDEDVTVTATFSQINYNIYRTVKTNDETSTAGGWLGRWNENCTLPDGATGDSYVVTANYGASIQFMAGTNNNYEILPENITAVDADGNPVSLNVADSYTTIDNDYGRLVTFTMPASPVTITANFTSYVSELYILGTANGNSWAGNLGVQMTKGGTDDAYYTARVYFAGNDTDGAYGYFNFTESLGNADWSNMGTRYGSKNGEHYDLEAHGWTGEMNWWDEHKEQSFKVPAGIYDIVVNKVKGQVTVTRVEPEFTFSPAAGEVLEGTTVTATSNLGDLLNAINSNVDASAATTKVSLSADGTYGASVTLNADGNVYACATYGQITYTSAPAAYTVTERGDYYEKVTSTTDLTDGEYLIVYEEGPVAFNGGLETLDAVHNYIDVTIEDDKIYATPTVDAAIFTWNATAGTLQSASGNYIGRTAASNGFNTSATANITNSITIEDGHAVITSTGGPKLQFFSNSGQERFRYYSSSQQAIQLYKKISSTVTVAQPTFDPASGAELVNGDEVTITAAEGCTLKYTVNNGTEQTTTSNTATVTVTEDATIKAKAVDGNNNESEEATATYTVLKKTTLADLEANPEQGKSYVISDMLTVAYVAADGTAYAKDADQDIEVTAGAHDYVATQLTDRSHTNKTANWIAITGLTDDNLTEGSRLTNVVGTLTDAVNFTLAVSQQPELSNPHVGYDVNTYIPCNFMGRSTQTGTNGQIYFFSTPQVNEFAHITNAVLASKTSGTSGEAGTYTMTIDGNSSGNMNVHWTSDATSLTWDEITWNTSITWQKESGYFNNGKEFAQIGSKSNPAATISMSTTGFGGKRITGVSFRASCTNTDGPTLTVTAGSQTLLTDIRILKSTDAGEDTYSTNSANVMMGENDALTFTINSSAAAGLYIYSLSVTYDDATGATGTFNLGTGAGVNTAGLSGEITVDLGSLGDSFTVGKMHTFYALIKAAAGGNGAPRRVAGNGNYSIQAVGNVSGDDIATAVDELQSGKAVDGVRYVNVAGQVAATPWQGVNIVVTRYTDGSTRTTKVVK